MRWNRQLALYTHTTLGNIYAYPSSSSSQSPPLFSRHSSPLHNRVQLQRTWALKNNAVLFVEDEYVAAEVSRNEQALRRLVDDRFIQNSPDGTTSGKEELIQAVLKLRMLGQTVRERTVLIEGDVALIFGTLGRGLTRPAPLPAAGPAVAPPALPHLDDTTFGPCRAPARSPASRRVSHLRRGDGERGDHTNHKAPKTCFNGRISPHRRFAFGQL